MRFIDFLHIVIIGSYKNSVIGSSPFREAKKPPALDKNAHIYNNNHLCLIGESNSFPCHSLTLIKTIHVLVNFNYTIFNKKIKLFLQIRRHYTKKGKL